MEYKRLEQSLIDIVKEEQAKLGYRKEDVRLYYPLSTLNHFFDTEDTVEEMAERLTHLPEDMKARLGEIAVTHKKDRFCFHIPEQGSEYVHEHTAENEFIKELIELVREHGCTKKKILELFGQYSENTITEEMNNGEFDFQREVRTDTIIALKMKAVISFITDSCRKIMQILNFKRMED